MRICLVARAGLELVTFRSQSRRFPSTPHMSTLFMFAVPSISEGSSTCNTFYERSFIYAAPTEWNKLDGRIRKITNFDLFKREIKTTLCLSYFDLYLYNIVLACCMFIDITVYYMLLLCYYYVIIMLYLY